MILWREFPALSALKTFEALGRLGNQSQAARELNVTQAAVSQQIRNLQAHIGYTLFAKDGRNITLTTEGKALHESVSSAFTQIQRTLQDTKSQKQSAGLCISLAPQFANYRFIPALSDFWAKHPDIKLKFSADKETVDLNDGEFDFAVRYGRGDWTGLISHQIERVNVSAFISKDLKARRPDWVENMATAIWALATDSPEISRNIATCGVDLDSEHHLNVDNSDQARSALLSGVALSAQKRSWLKSEIESGMVEEICEFPNPEGYGYYLVYTEKYLSETAQKFRDWILKLPN